jgi:hypothetical protein
MTLGQAPAAITLRTMAASAGATAVERVADAFAPSAGSPGAGAELSQDLVSADASAPPHVPTFGIAPSDAPFAKAVAGPAATCEGPREATGDEAPSTPSEEPTPAAGRLWRVPATAR